MPVDLKAVQKALEDFGKVAENLVKIFQNLPKALLKFADYIQERQVAAGTVGK